MASVLNSAFKILRKPKVTEKSALLSSVANAVVFEVHSDATKGQIKEAVEKIFKVKVTSVRTMNNMGKVKRVRMQQGRRRGTKKAYVFLEKGSSIDLIEGL